MKQIVNCWDIANTVDSDFHYRRRGKAWAKIVTGIDTMQRNGYAFVGRFLPDPTSDDLAEIELPDTRCLTVWYSDRGSTKHHTPHVALAWLHADLSVEEIEHVTGHDWALQLRDLAAKSLLAEDDAPPPSEIEQAIRLLEKLRGNSTDEMCDKIDAAINLLRDKS